MKERSMVIRGKRREERERGQREGNEEERRGGEGRDQEQDKSIAAQRLTPLVM
jgi:hypothetical protein